MVDSGDNKNNSGMHGAALEIFGGLAKSYERVLQLATLAQDRHWKRWVYDRAGVKPGERVLDIGCGTCLLEEKLDRSGCHFVGLDLTEQMVRIGASKRLGSIEGLLLGDAESLPFPEDTFDVVVSCYVPKYVEVTRFADEASRVLRTGGRIALYDFVRPRGRLSPLLKVYIQGVLPLVGCLLGLARSKSAITFKNLPRIIDEAKWNENVQEAFESEGIRTEISKILSHGVVCAYSGKKISRASL